MKTIKELSFKVPLEIRVKVSIQAHYIHMRGGSILVSLDKDGNENQEEMKINSAAIKEAKPLIDMVLKNIKKWKEDGCP